MIPRTSIRSPTSQAMPAVWPRCCPMRELRSHLGRHLPERIDPEAEKRTGWRQHGILVVAARLGRTPGAAGAGARNPACGAGDAGEAEPTSLKPGHVTSTRTKSLVDDLSPIQVLLRKLCGGPMDLKEEVRRRIADLTRAAYERGYRDGAQSALAEIESVSAEDLAEQLKERPASLEALGKTSMPGERRRTAAQKPKRQQPKRQRPEAKVNGSTPKAATVQRCIQELIASKGEARRDEVLTAARAENPKITGQDLLNGIRTLTQRGEVHIDPEERSRLLPAGAPSEAAVAS